NAGEVREVDIQGDKISGASSNGTPFFSYVPKEEELATKLSEKGIKVSSVPLESGMPGILSVLISWFPMLLFIGVWIFFMKQMQGGSKGAMGFGKSKAKLMTEHKDKITFQDVAGIDEAKAELEEVVEFLKNPLKFQKLGGKIPKGVLLVGPPGTGKTLLAKAVAGEAAVPFFTISGSDFVEMFVGVGASRVRDMFEQGKKSAPCIIFIDEIDAMGRHRGAGLGGGNDEREQTLNQLLVEMDGFEANEGVILVAATNRPDVLDPALLRPGRFDRQVVVPNPDMIGREKILKVHMKKVPLSSDVIVKVLARGTPGFSGADLANLVNEAALLSARKGRNDVSMSEFEEAKDKVMMGSERRSMIMTEDEKKLTAYHEAGHAVVAVYSPASDPIHKATIVPRGRALGMVMRLPEGDRVSMSKDKLYADLRVACGGRIAEEMIFGKDKVTTGASSDIRMVSDTSRRMVTEWGLSEKLGFLAYEANEQEVFLGRSVAQQKNLSDNTASIVDTEIRRISDEVYTDAQKILKKHSKQLKDVAEALLEYETLNGEQIGNICKGLKISISSQDDVNVKSPKAKNPKKRAGIPSTNSKGTIVTNDIDD
ncbi:ATP-dependent zinc metalloprotease FtsH, partial [Alphaproteobacteria bacterium]|nr:ATP-dependent zinc metalloprotease FtsH [Alphaproteobacteria bacterium]